MNIQQFIQYINRRNGWDIQGAYYSLIEEWRQWWMGHYAPFHDVREVRPGGALSTRPMYRLRMAKQAAEDWASLLLNDKTAITLSDQEASRWLLGEAGDQTGGLLGRLDFWRSANRLVELAFRSGTGAFVLSAEGLRAGDGGAVTVSPGASLWLDYLPAECILPVTLSHGRVIDCAFVSEVVREGQSHIYLQTHRLVERGGMSQYEICNEYFTSREEGERDQAAYQPAPLPAGMPQRFWTGSPHPWFALFSPAQVKNRPGGPGLGMAVYAEALDQARQCDLAFDNYCRDLYLGGKKVFYNRELLRPRQGEYLAPDQLRQQLFVQTEGDPDRDDWHEYNPDLRVEANGRAVQDALDLFSFKVGLGTRHYQFSGANITTATQYVGERQDMVQHANRHQTQIEGALLTILRTLLWAGRHLLGLPLQEDCQITIQWDDSYISAAETRRAQDKDDCLSGFLPKYRYNMIWRGMSEAEAREAVSQAQEEAGGLADGLTFGA